MIKHVFVVHSHITWLVTQLVILNKKLSRDEIVIVTGRNYKIDKLGYIQIKYPSFNNISPYKYIGLNLNNKDHILEVKRWNNKIAKLIKGDFLAYVPHLWHVTAKLLVSHKNCIGYFYIEEGMASYDDRLAKIKKINTKEFLSSWFKFRNKNFTTLFLTTNFFNFHHGKYKGAFCFSDDCFKNSKSKTIFDIASLASIYTPPKPLNCDCIVVFDTISISKFITTEESLSIVENVIFPSLKQKRFNTVAIKLHPDHYTARGLNEADAILKLFVSNNDITTVVLPETFILETYLIHYKIPIYCYVSSLSIYSSLLNGKVFTLINRLNLKNNALHTLSKDVTENFEYL